MGRRLILRNPWTSSSPKARHQLRPLKAALYLYSFGYSVFALFVWYCGRAAIMGFPRANKSGGQTEQVFVFGWIPRRRYAVVAA